MEQKVQTKRKIVKVLIWVVAILLLMGTMHILVNYFNIFEFLKAIHSGGWQH
jgi:hypothetical protein